MEEKAITVRDLRCAAQTVTRLAQEHDLGSVYVGSIQSEIPCAREFLSKLRYPSEVLVRVDKTIQESIVDSGFDVFSSVGDHHQCHGHAPPRNDT